MKYNSLKRQKVNTLKIPAFSGGVDLQNLPTDIKNNQLSECDNMWYKDSRLQTRPGFKGDISCAIKTEFDGYDGELKYDITDCEVYYDDYYHRIATASVLTDDYAYFLYVYLVDAYDNITPIGKMSFLRTTSDIFYTPINVLFYKGKAQTGAGVYALVTLQNQGHSKQRYYHIYEIDKSYSEWNRVFDYYIPTIYINGRGNKYDLAHSEKEFLTPSPKVLESQNMLSGKFHAYYTSDGYSNSFRLPFTDLASEVIVCRIYYTLMDYVEWKIDGDGMKDTKQFFGKEVSAEVDRDKGTVYFTTDSGDYAVPVMSMHHENNIKITASKDIENGIGRVVHSTCCIKSNSRLLFGGGADGNIVCTASYENPLYFPLNCCREVGGADSEITAFSVIRGKILAFKLNEMYLLSCKAGENINEISLLSDNDTFFKKADSISVTPVSQNVGCENKRTVAVCGNTNFWLGTDNNIYCMSSASSGEIVNITDCIKNSMPEYNPKNTFGVGNDKMYFLINGQSVIAVETATKSVYLWTVPTFLRLDGAFYCDGEFRFLCKSQDDSTLAFMATLNGDKDSCMTYDASGAIIETLKPIKSSMTTKYFASANLGENINVDNIYLSLWAVGKVNITVNGRQSTDISFGLPREEYSNGEHKAVKLIPHLYGAQSVYLTVSSEARMSIGETEISFRVTG